MINTTHKNVHFFNQINGKIPSSGVIDPEKISYHDLCYQCYKHGPDFLFGKFRIKYFNDEPRFPERIESISSEIKMNTVFRTIDERKRRRCDKIINKAIKIPVYIRQTNKKVYATFQPKNACKLEFADHLWIPLINQPQSDIVVLENN